MKKIISIIFLIFSSFNLYSEENPPVFDVEFGTKPINVSKYINPYIIKQGIDGCFYIGGDYGLIKLNSNGEAQWSLYYSGVESSNGLTMAEGNIGIDEDNNVYVGINIYLQSENKFLSYILKYNSNGSLVISRLLSAVSLDKNPVILGGVIYSSETQRIYVSFGYEETNGDIRAIGVFDKDLNFIKEIDFPLNPEWGFGFSGEIGIDRYNKIYIGGSYNAANIYVLKYDSDFNLEFEFMKDPIAPKMFGDGKVIPGGGYYIIDMEWDSNGWGGNVVHNISANGIERWYKLTNLDLYRHSVDNLGNFYGIISDQPNRFVKIGYDGEIRWSVEENDASNIWAIFIDTGSRIYTVGSLIQAPDDKPYYIARYVAEEPKRYSITADTFTPKIAYVNEYTEPLISTVTIYGTTNPVKEIPVNFTISTYPAGATGQELTIISTRTNQNGQAMTQLKLGNIPAEYGVTAFCPSCIPEFSSVTFTCCGKLKTDDFKQFDERWKSEYYDNICSTEPAGTGRYRPVYSCDDPIFDKPEYRDKKYQFTIWGKGCALSALATLINYYKDKYNLPISSTTPKDLNNWLSENYSPKKEACFDKNGNLNFYCINSYTNGKVEFLGFMDIIDYNREQLINQTNNDINAGLPVILKISNPIHYILVIGKCGVGFIVSDPEGKISIYDPRGNRSIIGIRRFKYVER